MCVSLAPASFSSTIVYGGEVSALGVHVLGYQNSVRNHRHVLAPLLERLGRRPTGNAMLLHFPAAEPMTQANMLDTGACPRILEDMARAVTPPPPAPAHDGLFPAGRSAGMPDAVVFTRGVYDVVLARDARYVPQALERVRPDKRPPLADAIFRAYSEWFPDWPVALCCFNTVDRARAEPLLWWYRPRNPAVLFAPALDAHDGRPPDLREQVPVDHTVIFGSDRLAGGVRVPYGLLRDPDAEPDYWSSPEAEERVAKSSDRAAGQALLAKFREQARERRADWERQQAIRPYLPEHVVGGRFGGRSVNGDFACRVADLLGGSPYIERLQPRELAGLAG